jgi:ATP-dependent Clp protease ATP-binding subunit ClpB
MQPTDPNKFTEQAWDAIVRSQDVARRLRNQTLEVEHIIIALLEQENGLAPRIFEKANVDLTRLQQQLEAFANRQAKMMNIDQLYLGRGLDTMLDCAETARSSWQDKFISVEHLLVGFAEDERIGRRCLRNFNLDPQDLELEIKAKSYHPKPRRSI